MKNYNDNNMENEIKFNTIIKPKNIIKKAFITFRSDKIKNRISIQPYLLKKNKLQKKKTINFDSTKYNNYSTKINNLSSNLIKSAIEESLKSLETSSTNRLFSKKKLVNLKNIFNSDNKNDIFDSYINSPIIKKNVENEDLGLKRYLLTKFKLAGNPNYKDSFTSNFRKSNQKYFSFMDIQHYYNNFIKFKTIKKNLFKNKKEEDLSDTSLNTTISPKKFLKDKNGIYLLNNTCRPNFNKYRKTFFKKQLNKYSCKKHHNSHLNIFKNFEKVKNKINSDNKVMSKKVKKAFSELDIIKKDIYSKKQSIEQLFYTYNKKRGIKEKIITNRILGEKNENNTFIEMSNNSEKENAKKKKFSIINSKNITFMAEKKVNKLFHDLLIFQLPKLPKKKYIRKVLYDIFIEFKNLLILSMMKNKDINIYKKGIDFNTFYNCNTKINQQGKIIGKKIFEIFNNKTDTKYMNLNHYIDGMLKIKESNKENKLDLFFEMLNNNSDGCLTYDDIYKLSIICLQKITLNIEDEADFEKYIKENDDKDIKIVEGLAEYFCKMIFKLVSVDIKEKIPLKLLKKLIIQGGEQADYIELLFGSSNFTL